MTISEANDRLAPPTDPALATPSHARHDVCVTTEPRTRRRLPLVYIVGLLAVITVVAGIIVPRLWTSEGAPGPEWVRVGSLQEVRTKGVMFLSELRAYIVSDPPGTPIALEARSPHLGEPVVYCQSSMWFEEPAHGAKFDRLGRYVLGPAPRGLDRLATIVQEGVVWVNPNEITLGPARGEHDLRPAGPFCSGGD